jgi:hypothetical protein
MAGIFKAVGGILGMDTGPVKEAELAHQSLQLHDGNITMAIDAEQSMIIMQIDEKPDGQPFIFDLKNHTLSNVSVYPPVGEYAPSSGSVAITHVTGSPNHALSGYGGQMLQDQIDDLRTEIENLKALLPSNDQSQTG